MTLDGRIGVGGLLVTLKGGLQSEVFGDTQGRIGIGGLW